jgi:hypothetical protein
MVDSKELFEEALRRLTSHINEEVSAIGHVWSRSHYKSSRVGGRFSEYSLRGNDKLSSDTRRLSGEEGSDRNDDLPACELSGEGNQQCDGGGVHSWFSDEFREILSKIDGSVWEVGWEEVDKDPELQIRLYTHIGNGGILKLTGIPKIPHQYEPKTVTYFGLDTEDNSLGKTHFYQFATRDEVYFTGHWAVMMAFLSRSNLRINKQRTVIWGTNIEYELGNIIKGWFAAPGAIDVQWAKGRLTKYNILYDANHDWSLPDDNQINMPVWDTLNHWQLRVSDMGKILTQHLGFDFTKLPSDFYGFRYAAMDAIISRSYACIQRHYYLNRGIQLKFTPGATALKFFTEGTDAKGKPLNSYKLYNLNEQDELEWLSEANRGGRTEVFSLKEHEGKIGYFDINSAYPYVMKHGLFPLPKIDHWREGHDKIEQAIKNPILEGIAEVEVDATNIKGVVSHVPYLGTVDSTYGRFVFPLGRWRTKYTFFEIRSALRFGYKFKYIKAAVYGQATQSPFSRYVDLCYAIREEGTKKGDKILRDIGKSLGNNLFGKFGQRLRPTKLSSPSNYNTDDIRNNIFLDQYILIEENNGFARHTNVIWSAYITAMCRNLLFSHITASVNCGNEILYCDTDSIFITGGEWPESHQTQLGALKHEGDLCYFKAILPKTYVYEMVDTDLRKYKAKGVPGSYSERFINEGLVEYDKPMKIREALRRKDFNTKEPVEAGVPAINAWVRVTKELKGDYTKRTVNEDGSTKPLWLEEV